MSKKPKILAVSGTPGTGKTEIARNLSLLHNYTYLDVKKLIVKEGISEGWDKKRQARIVDVKKLNSRLLELIKAQKQAKKGLVIDSHLAHFLPKKSIDLCIITKCDLKALKKRLEKRRYPKTKVRENLDAEIFDVCLNEALEAGHKVVVLDTTKASPRALARSIKLT